MLDDLEVGNDARGFGDGFLESVASPMILIMNPTIHCTFCWAAWGNG